MHNQNNKYPATILDLIDFTDLYRPLRTFTDLYRPLQTHMDPYELLLGLYSSIQITTRIYDTFGIKDLFNSFH